MEVEIEAKVVKLHGSLDIPENAKGIVLFAHGSGSSRMSPRNQFVAKMIRKKGIATLLFDLLTEEEERIDNQTAEIRFNISLLAERLIHATDWVMQNAATKHLKIGYFGSSTGAAAALIAAAQKKEIAAVVSRGGRPDLAMDHLSKVQAPTLLIVGSLDTPVIAMNKEAFEKLQTEKKMEIVQGATHLFEEKGTLEQVAEIAAHWFREKIS